MRVAGARRREDSARCLGSSSPCCCRIHTIAYHGHGSGKWSKVWGRASNKTRRRGANPSPRSWPRICGANALGGLAKRGRVRCGTLLHGQKIRRRHAGDALRVVSVTSEPSSRAFRWPPAPHPAFLRNATLSSFVERDLRRVVAPISEMCANDSHVAERDANLRHHALPAHSKPSRRKRLHSHIEDQS